jgi:putative endonuclease
MAAGHLDLGRAGEDAAAEFLAARGFTLLARNWRKDRLELDLVCRDGDAIVFVEVKARGEGALGTGAEALGAGKRSRLAKAAALFLSEQNLWREPCRFDVVLVGRGPEGLSLTHVPAAFELPAGGPGWQPF